MEKEKKIGNLELPKVIYPTWGLVIMIIIFVLFVLLLSKIDIKDYILSDNNLQGLTLLDYIIQNIVGIRI